MEKKSNRVTRSKHVARLGGIKKYTQFFNWENGRKKSL
jgi:hypothetical protein